MLEGRAAWKCVPECLMPVTPTDFAVMFDCCVMVPVPPNFPRRSTLPGVDEGVVTCGPTRGRITGISVVVLEATSGLGVRVGVGPGGVLVTKGAVPALVPAGAVLAGAITIPPGTAAIAAGSAFTGLNSALACKWVLL